MADDLEKIVVKLDREIVMYRKMLHQIDLALDGKDPSGATGDSLWMQVWRMKRLLDVVGANRPEGQ